MKSALIVSAATALFLAAGSSYAQKDAQGQGQAIVTIVPSHPSEQAIQVSQQDIKEIKVSGKPSQVTGWTSLRQQPLELILLIDSELSTDFGNQLNEINQFAKELPNNTQMAIAWMQNGNAILASPLSSDPAQITKGVHLPNGIAGGVNSSPYFSLDNLAKNWPSQDRHARREVLMISDGIDDYNPRFDPNDPYMQTAKDNSIRAGIVVYSIFWPDNDRLSRFGWTRQGGQNLLTELTEATGGTNFWQGTSSPVNIQPYFKDLRTRVENQYAIDFTAPARGKPSIESFSLELSVPSAKVDYPRQVLVVPSGQAEK